MSSPAGEIIRLARVMNIQCVLDIGANTGQFGSELISHGFRGRMISFEPLSDCFEELSRNASAYPDWHCRHLALGAEDGEAVINVSANRYSSSILPATSWSIREHGPIAPIAQQRVTVRRLDTLWSELPFPPAPRPLMLKMDVQGFEPQVLAGLGDRLYEIDLLLLEASLLPCYEGETLFEVLVSILRGRGMHPVWIGPGWGSPATGQVFQCDIAFARDPIVGVRS